MLEECVELVVRTIAMPGDTNPNGDIFGGWVLSQMDLGGGIIAKQNSTTGRIVTASIESMSFLSPIQVGDVVSCYAKVVHRGRTSIKIQINTYTHSYLNNQTKQVTQGLFTYVAVDEDGKPTPLKQAK